MTIKWKDYVLKRSLAIPYGNLTYIVKDVDEDGAVSYSIAINNGDHFYINQEELEAESLNEIESVIDTMENC